MIPKIGKGGERGGRDAKRLGGGGVGNLKKQS